MSVRDLRKLTAENDELTRVQEYVGYALKPFVGCPIIDGTLLTDIALISGATEVSHKLGRELRGYIVVKKDANANIWDSQATNTRSKKTLILNSSAATTVSLWVF